MAEAGIVDAAVGTDVAVVSDAATTSTPTIIGPDGKFTPEWRNSLPEELRLEKSLNSITDLTGLAKSYVSTKRMVGMDKIPIPGPHAGQAEWDAYYDAGGRPKTAQEYAFKRPEEVPEEIYKEETVKAAQDLFHKIGLSKKQADAIFSFNNTNVVAEIKAAEQYQEQQKAEAESTLRAEWGAAFDQKKHLGNLAISQAVGGNEEWQAKLVEKFGNDPDFIRFAANLGAKFAESTNVVMPKIDTPGDIQSQINELIQTDAYSNRNNPDHKLMVQRVARLFEKKHAPA